MASNELNTSALPPDALLWHYTDFKGLEGILAGKIWASSVMYLNDTREYIHGLEIALEILQNQLQLAIARQGQFNGAAIAVTIHKQVLAAVAQRYQPVDIFVAAFSTKKDDLSQWRAYGRNGGPQFSVGFCPTALERRAIEYSSILEEVKYKRKDIEPEITLALQAPLDHIIGEWRDSPSRAPELAATSWADLIAANLKTLAPIYKDPTFEDEQEWRLIREQPTDMHDQASPLKFRQSGSLVIPYIEIPLCSLAAGTAADSPIAAITIGPSPHPTHLGYAVAELATRQGLRVRIDTSAVPFRNW